MLVYDSLQMQSVCLHLKKSHIENDTDLVHCVCVCSLNVTFSVCVQLKNHQEIMINKYVRVCLYVHLNKTRNKNI
jgi:hypothetical protein